jgi:hypothetical protein
MKPLVSTLILLLSLCFSISAQKSAIVLKWQYENIPGTQNEYECTLHAENFDDILSIQFTLNWDVNNVSFLKLAPQQLPDLTENNYNTQTTDKGFIRFLWIDLDLKGVQLPKGSPLFSLHVKTQGNPPRINISSEPLSIEVIDTDNVSRQLMVSQKER